MFSRAHCRTLGGGERGLVDGQVFAGGRIQEGSRQQLGQELVLREDDVFTDVGTDGSSELREGLRTKVTSCRSSASNQASTYRW